MAGGALVTNEVFVKNQVGYEVRCEAVCESGTVIAGRNWGELYTTAAGPADGSWGGTIPLDFGSASSGPTTWRSRPGSTPPSATRWSVPERGTGMPPRRSARRASSPSDPAGRLPSTWSTGRPSHEDRARPVHVPRRDDPGDAAGCRGGPGLRVDRAVPTRGLHPLLPPPARRRLRRPGLQEGAQRGRCGGVLSAAPLPVVWSG